MTERGSVRGRELRMIRRQTSRTGSPSSTVSHYLVTLTNNYKEIQLKHLDANDMINDRLNKLEKRFEKFIGKESLAIVRVGATDLLWYLFVIYISDSIQNKIDKAFDEMLKEWEDIELNQRRDLISDIAPDHLTANVRVEVLTFLVDSTKR